jgi:hypothetical protein
METWTQILAPGGTTDMAARLIASLTFFIWNVFEGSRFDTPYPVEWVILYPLPYWRLFLVFITIVACAWCPRVGSMVALALFFYIGDMFHLTQPWVKTQTQQSAWK